MKKIIKNNIKTIIMMVITAIVVGTGTVFAVNYLAKDVSFTPNNKNWNVTNVEDALNSLYSLSESTNCTSGIYHHDGLSLQWNIDTGIKYNSFMLMSYTPNTNLYLMFSYNKNIIDHIYSEWATGTSGKLTSQYREDDFVLSDTGIIFNKNSTSWNEVINPSDVYWVACK